MIYNLANRVGLQKATEYFNDLTEKQKKIEINEVKVTRSWRANRALHLFFEMVAKELNILGMTYVYRGLEGIEYEVPWTKELFKEFHWKPLQLAMFGTKSTTKLTSQQIDEIFMSINLFFAERGIEVTFPNQFDFYLKFYSDEKFGISDRPVGQRPGN